MLDGRHHGEGKHDERDVAMPTMPGSGFIMVKPKLILGCLETVLDCPAVAFDAGKCLD